MYRLGVVVLAIVCSVVYAQDFPAGFQFGVATAAYQVEGAWNVSGRSPSVWDEFVHSKPAAIVDRSTGDVACDSYYLWRRDVEMVSELGLNFYRFSLSWTRLFPNGFTNHVNKDGRRYYDDLIDTLNNMGIQPVVTMFHWDLPQKFQDLGGWTNPLVVEWFAEYARAVYSLFADRVSTWITINEPVAICDVVYHTGMIAPGILSPGLGNYICIKNVLLAHARAWRIYDEEFRSRHNGKVANTNMHIAFEPAPGVTDGAAELASQLYMGMYAHPIFSSEGGWPPMIEKIIATRSSKEGYSHSRLPVFTQEEKQLIRGTYDFYGMNFYTGRLVRKAQKHEKIGTWPFEGSSDLDLIVFPDPDWKASPAFWIYVHPEGIRRQLKWVKDQFGDMEIIITENGYADTGTDLNDQARVEYFREHMKQVLLSIHEDGANVTGYTAWSLMDNFEWNSGYTHKFGLYAVNFSSPQRTRTPRASALYYAAVAARRSLDVDFHNPYDADADATRNTQHALHTTRATHNTRNTQHALHAHGALVAVYVLISYFSILS